MDCLRCVVDALYSVAAEVVKKCVGWFTYMKIVKKPISLSYEKILETDLIVKKPPRKKFKLLKVKYEKS